MACIPRLLRQRTKNVAPAAYESIPDGGKSSLEIRNFRNLVWVGSLICTSVFAQHPAQDFIRSGPGIPLDLDESLMIQETNASAVRDTIHVVAEKNGWRVLAEADGVISLIYPASPKNFEAVFNLYYSPKDIRIRYVSSRNLDEFYGCYGKTGASGFDPSFYPVCGHRKLNLWSYKLRNDLLKVLQRSETNAELNYR